jgi:glycosyltransferase involved in cell wall biosynthesis
LRDKTYDIAHLFENRPTVIYPGLFLKQRGVPIIMDWADWFGQGGSVEERTNPLVRTMLRPIETYFENHYRVQADSITSICAPLSEKAVSLGIPPSKIYTLRNCSDTERFYPQDCQEAQKRLGLPHENLYVGYMGAIFPRDAKLLASTFDIIHRQIPETRLLVIGACNVDIRKLVNQPETVVQTGLIPENLLNDYLSSCDICLLPLSDTGANRGRWPLKLNDYLASGRAIVLTKVGEMASFMADHQAGSITDCNPDAIALGSITLLRSPLMRARMGKKARAVALEFFQLEGLTQGLEAHYTNVINKVQYQNTVRDIGFKN